ncbi:hypothetical protein ASPWEDRAFT_118225 [Aspergillus wentii DTO 134E9]|uniref:Enoyl reductase (ER) domain-containing protein n=1 Tax=Aspergillus wentii DTO 134E9 TaxID=1073089 RepID=A0A1L9RB77_ASPWE|nr:uncharacterized protein ASPWEDRAFT_118225 [Aspergillus wentii DTO 134E9]KAI9934747.1 hypothetical protein MW887_000364 [Aspergillus wentii]OJJ32175.1 hypothetical protein ASPWEDRAFT_118225 [Aspergillus wentii DTO 134E9]
MATATYTLESPLVIDKHVVTQPQPSPRQSVLMLNGFKQPYSLVDDHTIPSIFHSDEILVKVVSIGLNPIDWKAPAFKFGIPSLPWINGRDLAGIVVKTSSSSSSRLKVGDTVLVPSTDYRDIRKAAFQEYAITTHFNAARIPSSTSTAGAASLGVAFVAASLALGVSLGLDLSKLTVPGPDLVDVLRYASDIPENVKSECFPSERVKAGEWIVIWGGSTTTGLITLQLAKLAGLKVITVVDAARHGQRLLAAGTDLLVDRHDPQRAIEIIRGLTGSNLRYAIDIVGRDTATLLQQTLKVDPARPSHLLGLTGLPKEQVEGIQYHTVPIKVFHACPAVGEGLVRWLEGLLEREVLTLPEVVRVSGGLGAINEALERLRDGTVSGKRIVVDLD